MTRKSKLVKQTHYYGWVIVFIGAMIVFFSGPGQTYSISLFIDYYVDELGWSRSLVSAIYSFATLIAGLSLPLIGKRIDKHGHRKMTFLISIALAIATLWMSFVMFPWMLFVGFYLMRLFGQGSMTLSASTLIPQWFVKKRGIALSYMAVGGVLGSTLIPIINANLIDYIGAVWTWRFWGMMLVLIMSTTALFFLHDNPHQKGISIDDELNQKSNIQLKLTSIISLRNIEFTLKQALKTKAFWFMLFSAAVPAMINTGFTFHMVSIMSQKMYGIAFAALVLSVTAIAQFPFTFIAGWLLDRLPVHLIRAFNFLVLLGAMILLLWAQTPTALILYAIVHGIFVAFDSVSNGVLWPNYFGLKHLGSIRSIAMMAMVIGSSLGPLPFGVAYDYFGSYQQIVLLMMIFPVLSVFACIFSPPPSIPK
jgi:MFS family permease